MNAGEITTDFCESVDALVDGCSRIGIVSDKVPLGTWQLFQAAIHEVMRFEHRELLSAHLVIAAIRLETPGTQVLWSSGLSFRTARKFVEDLFGGATAAKGGLPTVSDEIRMALAASPDSAIQQRPGSLLSLIIEEEDSTGSRLIRAAGLCPGWVVQELRFRS